MNSLEQIESDGFSILPSVFDQAKVAGLLDEIQLAIERGSDGNIKSSLGETYAARNLATLNPELLDSWKCPELTDLLNTVLGPDVGLVRILYFDKHPNRTWSLPWHKDMTVAVKDNNIPSERFTKPTRKSGVDHVEASTEQLQEMLTLRIHLDEVTDENGPLEVARGSHLNGKSPDQSNEQVTIHSAAGDVLAMRPLLSHASGSSTEGTTRHRRILHLEFASNPDLPDGFEWHMFEKV